MPNFNPETSKFNKFLEYFLAMCLGFAAILTICFWIVIVIAPRGPLTIGYLIPELYFTFPVKLGVIISHCYFVTILVTNIVVHSFCTFIYLAYFTVIITKELNLRKRRYKSDSSLRSPSHLRHIFRSFQFLHQHASSFLGVFVLVGSGEFMISIIYTSFVLIRYGGMLHTSIYCCLLLVIMLLLLTWTILLELGREFYRRGNHVLVSWQKEQGWSKDMKKFVRSCKPILICYGKQYVLGPSCVLNFYRGIVRGTQRALLTTVPL